MDRKIMKLYIKNMVCDRCTLAVRRELDKNKIAYQAIELGEVELTKVLSAIKLQQFSTSLSSLGFELIEDKKARIISKIKNSVIELIRNLTDLHKTKLSAYISDKLNKDYDSLSSMFSEVEGVTLEKYFIQQKIERVKELLVYDELTLSQIAAELGYSSVNHLSSQFKKITGLTPTHFKKIGAQKRKSLDQI
jgi:AraC family transcriptional regulator